MTRRDATLRRVDRTALRVNQLGIILLLLVAFIIDQPWLVALVGGVMLLGTVAPSLALFKQLSRRVLQPAGLVRADIVSDNPEPHRFAQGFGGVVVVVGLSALLAKLTLIGWGLVWLVIALAALNLLLGFCAGCFLYYQLQRLGVPGFNRQRLSRSDGNG